MKTALGVALLLSVGAAVSMWPGSRVGPEPVAYGRDVCAQCRMHISQPGFAGEIRDRDGMLTKYDDIGCMLRAMMRKHQEIPEAWVEDHGGGGFVPLLSATLVRLQNRNTPMGHGLIAFATAAAADEFVRSHRGELLALEEILSDPARFLAGTPADSHVHEVHS